MLNGNKIDSTEIIERIRAAACSNKEMIELRLWISLYKSGVKIKGRPIDPKGIFEKFSSTENTIVKTGVSIL